MATRKFTTLTLTMLLLVTFASAQSNWKQLPKCPIYASDMWLLKDGRVLAHEGNSNKTAILTPDSAGGYVHGTWVRGPALPTGYTPYAHSAALLPDGRLIFMGGEYNEHKQSEVPFGAILDAKATYWTYVPAPLDFKVIGDAPSALLPNGTYMQCNPSWHNHQCVLLNAANMMWTRASDSLSKNLDESGFALTADGHILNVPSQPVCGSDRGTQLYDWSTDKWSCGNDLNEVLYNQGSGNHENGSTMQLYNGDVIQFPGAVGLPGLHVQLRDSFGVWRNGPMVPGTLTQFDAPSALEPNGKVLAVLGDINPPKNCQFYEYDPNGETLNWIPGPPVDCGDGQNGRLMTLPTGEILYAHFSNDLWAYSQQGIPTTAVAATIYPTSFGFTAGSTNNVLLGLQLNGLSTAQGYGDDYQAATNYPLVQFVSPNGQVFSAFTHDGSYSGIAPGKVSTVMVDVPKIPAGPYMMQVVTNGIRSNQVSVRVTGGKQ